MNSRTAGAPSLPIASEEEMQLADLDAALAAGDITAEQYAQMKAALGARQAGIGAPPMPQSDEELRVRFRELGGSNPETRDAARAAFIAEGVDNVRQQFAAGDQRVAARARDRAAQREAAALGPGPRTGTYEDYAADVGVQRSPTWRMEQEGQDMADARQYGRRHGGGDPFRSEAEREAYTRRNILSEAQKQALREQGMSDRDIALMQMSEYDKAAIQSGHSGGSGWVPIYTPSGGITYAERAVSPGFGLSQTQIAFGTQRVGDRVKRGEVSASLDRPDLMELGYTPESMSGPYGPETVWMKTALGPKTEQRLRSEGGLAPDAPLPTLDEYRAQQEASRRERRLRTQALQAGLTAQQLEGQSTQQLRDLIRDARAVADGQRREGNRRARMAAPFRRELAFSELGQGNDWQDAVAAENLAPGLEGMTPIQRDAQSMQNMLRMMNMEALAGADPLNRDVQRRQLDAAERATSPALAGISDLRAGDYFSPEAELAITNMAKQFDTTTGGFSVENERQFARYLTQEFKIPPGDAERLANIGANSRRRAWRQEGPPSAGTASPPAAGPAPGSGGVPPATMAPPAIPPLNPAMVYPGAF